MERRSETIKVHKLKDKVLLYYIDDNTGSTQGIDLSYQAYEALARHFGTGALEVCTDELGDCNIPLVNGWLSIEQIAQFYGQKVKCKWLTPDGNDWLDKEMTVNAHFLKEMEQGSIKEACR